MHVSDAARIVLGVWILTNALHKPECGVACALGCAVLERVRFGRVCGCMLLAFGIAEQTMPFLIGMAECFVQIMSGFIGAYGPALEINLPHRAHREVDARPESLERADLFDAVEEARLHSQFHDEQVAVHDVCGHTHVVWSSISRMRPVKEAIFHCSSSGSESNIFWYLIFFGI